jgi:hypothetical protein
MAVAVIRLHLARAVRLHAAQVRMRQRLERAPITLDDRGMRD